MRRDYVAANLVRMRVAKGWTQADLAVRAKLAERTVSRIETGMNAPGWETLQMLAEALGCTDLDLMAEPAPPAGG
jgi:transcriptional regulator with XRE-family HTH domain